MMFHLFLTNISWRICWDGKTSVQILARHTLVAKRFWMVTRTNLFVGGSLLFYFQMEWLGSTCRLSSLVSLGILSESCGQWHDSNLPNQMEEVHGMAGIRNWLYRNSEVLIPLCKSHSFLTCHFLPDSRNCKTNLKASPHPQTLGGF